MIRRACFAGVGGSVGGLQIPRQVQIGVFSTLSLFRHHHGGLLPGGQTQSRPLKTPHHMTQAQRTALNYRHLEDNHVSLQAWYLLLTRVPDEVFEGFLLLGERGEVPLFLRGSSIDQEIHSGRPNVRHASKRD